MQINIVNTCSAGTWKWTNHILGMAPVEQEIINSPNFLPLWREKSTSHNINRNNGWTKRDTKKKAKFKSSQKIIQSHPTESPWFYWNWFPRKRGVADSVEPEVNRVTMRNARGSLGITLKCSLWWRGRTCLTRAREALRRNREYYANRSNRIYNSTGIGWESLSPLAYLTPPGQQMVN